LEQSGFRQHRSAIADHPSERQPVPKLDSAAFGEYRVDQLWRITSIHHHERGSIEAHLCMVSVTLAVINKLNANLAGA